MITKFIVITSYIHSLICIITGGHKYGNVIPIEKNREYRQCKKCGKLIKT